jgi:hypothetical protein
MTCTSRLTAAGRPEYQRNDNYVSLRLSDRFGKVLASLLIEAPQRNP